ncbi:MAG: CRTAC1 family protein, partial [Acidobacteriota bacterium]
MPALLLLLTLPSICFAQAPPKPHVTFEEVPAKKSGITWVHNNAHSSDRYLPETVGAGCAFLDYDNDGWIDIYLVNSGPSDFYAPSTPL